ncbi:CatB-related O-acetyltransferase [Pseudoalteromonas distincta]|uniref:CatB-related O-acetyltransferase n=1 Tax=Pseudoalteromonas distincta TaxID=77608 RepID=UPI00020A0158|nr:CatB-related O-acetyltransferase [Pseudoalteromonas distincta]EGI74691.1 chloramphenicol acetyltransferase [Pseudoalteromonas distincta]
MLLILKSIASKFYRQVRLVFFQRDNRIFSFDANLKSFNGSCIEVREGTVIDSSSSIGSYSYIGRNCFISKSSIGRYCSIANNVSIGQGEHDLTKISTSSIFYDSPYELLTSKNCIIKDDVWIGVDAIILRGVTVGTGAVVGANSVVTKDVPPYSVVVGSPAKLIKYRFEEDKITEILKSEWWKETPKAAKKIFTELNKK